MDMADVRRKALRKLIAERFGGVARQMAIACKKPEGQINDMLSTPPRKSFGEKVARQIEQALGLPVGHLDVESDCLVSDQGHRNRVNTGPRKRVFFRPRLHCSVLTMASPFGVILLIDHRGATMQTTPPIAQADNKPSNDNFCVDCHWHKSKEHQFGLTHLCSHDSIRNRIDGRPSLCDEARASRGLCRHEGVLFLRRSNLDQ